MSNAMSSPHGFMGPPGGGGGSKASSEDVENLVLWIHGCFDRAEIVQFALEQHVIETMGPEPVAQWSTVDFENKDPRWLAESVMHEAKKAAETQRGTTRYVATAFKKGSENKFSRMSFRLFGGAKERG
jgi:hypothetical protein